MSSLIQIVVGFILTGVVGNWLVSRWQNRNWLAQQQFNGTEKEYIGLKELADEIAMLLGERIYHTQRLLQSIHKIEEERFKTRHSEYDEVVKRWNVRLTSFYVRLSLLTDEGVSLELERKIQNKLVIISNAISRLLMEQDLSITTFKIDKINKIILNLQGAAINFNKNILNTVLNRRKELYEGRVLKYSVENLDKFSNWELFKAIFTRDVDSLTVVRSAFHFR